MHISFYLNNLFLSETFDDPGISFTIFILTAKVQIHLNEHFPLTNLIAAFNFHERMFRSEPLRFL